jgi:hypothetical protein
MIPKYRCSCNTRARSRAKTLLTTTPHICGINPLSCVENVKGWWVGKTKRKSSKCNSSAASMMMMMRFGELLAFSLCLSLHRNTQRCWPDNGMLLWELDCDTLAVRDRARLPPLSPTCAHLATHEGRHPDPTHVAAGRARGINTSVKTDDIVGSPLLPAWLPADVHHATHDRRLTCPPSVLWEVRHREQRRRLARAAGTNASPGTAARPWHHQPPTTYGSC